MRRRFHGNVASSQRLRRKTFTADSRINASIIAIPAEIVEWRGKFTSLGDVSMPKVSADDDDEWI